MDYGETTKAILDALQRGEMRVTDLAEITGRPVRAISKIASFLHSQKRVERRQVNGALGRWYVYRSVESKPEESFGGYATPIIDHPVFLWGIVRPIHDTTSAIQGLR